MVVEGFLSELGVDDAGKLNALFAKLRRLQGFHEGNVLLQELPGQHPWALRGKLGWLLFKHLRPLAILEILLGHLPFYDEVILEVVEQRQLIHPRLVHVVVDDSGGDLPVTFGVLFVQHDEEEVESGEERVRQSHVLGHRHIPRILPINGVGSGDDTAPGIEADMDASLGDGDGLLLHDLMDGHPVDVAHLVELVDAHHPSVRQHHRARLQVLLPSVLVNSHRRSQSHTR
mmetsp:Transcript_6/g.8  ORF Transcript_6/g.8 Transcript_6/m.8 type:complete len:230 (+) Transcript_6:715-1404(+)